MGDQFCLINYLYIVDVGPVSRMLRG